MNIVQIMYLIFGSVMVMTTGIIVLVVAGKDILIAFKRKFSKRGCDVYVANQERTISHFFMTPIEGVFRINKLPYVTNPEKTINLTEDERRRVTESITKTKKRLNDRIIDLTKQKDSLNKTMTDSKDDKQKYYLAAQIERTDQLIRDFSDKLRMKQENYFKDKKPAFFYIENDPIPKDFYEFYSGLDSKMIDNMVSRAISSPRTEKQDKQSADIKKFMLITMGVAGLAAILAFRAVSMLQEICQSMGLSCTVS